MIGFLVAALGLSEGAFSVDVKINILDAVNLAVTVGVLFYLQNIVSSRNTMDRIEKDLIIERLRWVSQKLILFREFCQREIAAPSEFAIRNSIKSEVRSVESALMEVRALLEATPLDTAKNEFEKLVRGISKIKVSLTGGSFPRNNLDEKTNRLVALQTDARLRDLNKFIVHINRL